MQHFHNALLSAKSNNIVIALVERVGEMSANISNKGKQELVCCWPSLLDINRFAYGRLVGRTHEPWPVRELNEHLPDHNVKASTLAD